MMFRKSDDYLAPYRRQYRRGGADFDVTLWAGEVSQQRRFEVMVRMCPMAGQSVLDAGCSRGDFAAFLLQNGQPYRRYIGVDGLCEVIDYAQTRNLRDAEFYCGDFVADPAWLRTDEPEVIAISGSLNTMDDATAMGVLDTAWEAASRTLIFNFLSDRVAHPAPKQSGPARRLDTIKLLDWALDRTWAVQFQHDYFKDGHDATIMMRKQA